MSTPPKYTVLLPSRWGWFVGMKSDPFQTGSVATQGEWAPNESQLLRTFLRPGDTALDVGANVGNMTLAFAAAVGEQGLVFAFEPQRYCFGCLMSNITLNSLNHRVEAYRVAVGDAPGAIDVPLLDPLQPTMNFGGVSLLDKHTVTTEQVAVVTIDSLDLSACRLIKADVEGMEPTVLRGAKETIKKHRPVLWVEELRHGGKDCVPELKEIFAEHNYRAWKCCTGLFSDLNTRECRHNMFQMNGENMQDHNVLALPREAPVPEWTNQATVFLE